MYTLLQMQVEHVPVNKEHHHFWLDREPHLSAILPGTAGTAEHRDKLIESLAQIAGDVN
jgi:hypothetical protein